MERLNKFKQFLGLDKDTKELKYYRIKYTHGGNLLDVYTTYVDAYDKDEADEKFFRVIDGSVYDILDITDVTSDLNDVKSKK